MKLVLIEYTCATDGTVFEFPGLSEYSYSEFLLMTSVGEMAYLNALEDQTYKELKALIDTNVSVLILDSDQRVDLLQHVYGEIACDRASSGAPYSIELMPSCPACSGSDIASWSFTGKVVDVHVEPVAHVQWSRFSASEKEEKLIKRLSQDSVSKQR